MKFCVVGTGYVGLSLSTLISRKYPVVAVDVIEKKVEMIHLKDLTAVTGYIKGGCSPVGMKKQYPVIIDDSALKKDIIYVSAGKPGYSMGVEPDALASVTGASFVSLTTDN